MTWDLLCGKECDITRLKEWCFKHGTLSCIWLCMHQHEHGLSHVQPCTRGTNERQRPCKNNHAHRNECYAHYYDIGLAVWRSLRHKELLFMQKISLCLSRVRGSCGPQGAFGMMQLGAAQPNVSGFMACKDIHDTAWGFLMQYGICKYICDMST